MHAFVEVCFGVVAVAVFAGLFLWCAAIAFAMIADVTSSIFSAAQAVWWEIYHRLSGRE